MRYGITFSIILISFTCFAQEIAAYQTKVNRLFTGIENEVRIVVENSECDSIEVTCENCTVKGEGCSWKITPHVTLNEKVDFNGRYLPRASKEGYLNLLIKVKSADSNFAQTRKFRLQSTPLPDLRFSYKVLLLSDTNEIKRSRLMSDFRFRVEYFDFYQEAHGKVSSFDLKSYRKGTAVDSLIGIKNGKVKMSPIDNCASHVIDERVISFIRQLEPNDVLVFENVLMIGMDGREVSFNIVGKVK